MTCKLYALSIRLSLDRLEECATPQNYTHAHTICKSTIKTMNVFKMIVILPLLRRNTDLGLNGHPITYWLIKICFRLRILIRFKRYLEIVQSVKSYFAKLNIGPSSTEIKPSFAVLSVIFDSW